LLNDVNEELHLWNIYITKTWYEIFMLDSTFVCSVNRSTTHILSKYWLIQYKRINYLGILMKIYLEINNNVDIHVVFSDYQSPQLLCSLKLSLKTCIHVQNYMKTADSVWLIDKLTV
jgi:hypothetical protein